MALATINEMQIGRQPTELFGLTFFIEGPYAVDEAQQTRPSGSSRA